MKKSRFSDSQILSILKPTKNGMITEAFDNKL